MKDLMINSNANKTFSDRFRRNLSSASADIPPFMIKTNDKMSAQAAEVLRTDRTKKLSAHVLRFSIVCNFLSAFNNRSFSK